MTDRALVKNAADPKQVADGQRKETDRSTRDDDDLRSLLELPAFRRFAWRYMGQAGMFVVTDPLAPESLRAFADGSRLIGNTLFHDIQRVSIDGYLLMQREALTEKINASSSRRRRPSREPERNVHTPDTLDSDANTASGDDASYFGETGG